MQTDQFQGLERSPFQLAVLVRKLGDKRAHARISALSAGGLLMTVIALGALLTALFQIKTLFFFFLVLGLVGALAVYYGVRLTFSLRKAPRLIEAYQPFLQTLISSGRVNLSQDFENVLRLSFKLEDQNAFLLNLVGESFDFDAETTRNLLTLSQSSKGVLNLEESAVLIEQMYIHFQSGLLGDEEQSILSMTGLVHKMREAEFLADFLEKCLLLERAIAYDLSETVQFCLQVLGKEESQVFTMVSQFSGAREERRAALLHDFAAFLKASGQL